MVYYYMVGYGSYEESHFTYLTHEEKVDLKEEIRKAIPKALEKMVAEKDLVPHSNFQDLNQYIPGILVEDSGFKIIEPDDSFTFFGWHHINPEEAWKNDLHEEDEFIYKALEDAGWTREKIKKIADENWKRHEEEWKELEEGMEEEK